MPHLLVMLQRTFPLSSASVSEARLAVAALLHQQGTDPAVIDGVALATSELCANAVEAANGTSFDVEVLASNDASCVALHVRNDGHLEDIPNRSAWRPNDPLALRGRGLGIVDAVAGRLEFAADEDRLTAIATFE